MRASKIWPIAVYLVLISIGVGATVYFSISGKIEVIDSKIKVEPYWFRDNISKGAEFVKELNVKNYGQETCVYFTYVIQGPDSENVSVKFKNSTGEFINYYNKICLPSGSESEPSNTKVYAHIQVNETAESGSYAVYIFVRSD
uniref:DUF1616 domain-containing protein n=1 Tax=Archaeoglobus fulgidus TaxID=2234 RepID=A0A7J2TJF4_ARCFL